MGIMSTTGDADPGHTCKSCGKSYQRHDLLNRHKRRCQGPAKPFARQKACHACVQSKTKCSYSYPSCARCIKRGVHCQYANDTNAEAHVEEIHDLDSLMRDLYNTSDSGQSTSWPSSLQSWDLDTFDAVLPDAQPPLLASAAPPAASPLRDGLLFGGEYLEVMSRSASLGHDMTTLSTVDSLGGPMSVPMSTSMSASAASGHTSPLSTAPHVRNPSNAHSVSSSPCNVETHPIANLLADYLAKLLRENFETPLLHRALYADREPDISVLRRTAMAVACGRGVQLRDSYRFMQRAMDVERHRLIEDFPHLRCMEQWDAMHAMILYEVLELREDLPDKSLSWKQKPRTRGLRVHFLLKMARCYLASYPEIRNPNHRVFADPASTPQSDAQTTWPRWQITETARRTLFLINIINWYGHSDHVTGKPTPYYEPLNDDLILDIPLPCSHAAWMAEDEDQWQAAIQMQDLACASPESTPYLVLPGQTLRQALSSPNGDALRRYARDCLHNDMRNAVGLDDSDQLRNLIILCATEQFA